MKQVPTAAYIRVSTQEQKLHGISLDAQRDKLKEYADSHNLHIVNWYEDEGVSGRKLIKNRPALQRMIADAQKDNFKHIIFIKLDRFFRSVAEYHEAMKMLGDVTWTATEEKYDMTTANGRAFINMKLTIAELEADQTGERIRLVNDFKVKEGKPLSGSMPLGFKIVQTENGKRVAHDDEKGAILLDIIEHFKRHQNKHKTSVYLLDTYGIQMELKSLSRLFSNTMLYGSYRGNPNYCEPYITKEEFDELQTLLPRSGKANTRRVYLFSGLYVCPVCGSKMAGNTATYKGKAVEYQFYRCPKRYRNHLGCTNKITINENILEEQLIERIEPLVKNEKKKYTIRAKNKSKKSDPEPIKAEIKRLNYMFQKNRITVEDYDRQYDALMDKLNALHEASNSPTTRDFSHIEELLNGDWKTLYNALNRENRRIFWRTIIDTFSTTGKEIDNIFFK